jgi:predicted amidohydrolase YtcJ
MHALGLAWSTQPGFRPAYEREWGTIFAPERRARLMPLGIGHELGLPMLFNSDTPCSPVDPLAGIRAATDPKAGPEATVPRLAAWRASTTAAADVAGEPRLGRLTPGSLADLAIFDADPLAATTDLGRLRLRATMVGGVLVHEAAEGAA